MPSNKDRVASYLEDDEKLALDKFCNEKGLTGSQGVAYLIRTNLLEPENPESPQPGVYDERLTDLEKSHDRLRMDYAYRVAFGEKMEEDIAELQNELDRLKNKAKREQFNHYEDEHIASITGQPKEKVYLWRMGLTKPRGHKILEKLAPYEVREGRWVRKSR